MAAAPVIVLAFANEQEGERYLRNLPEELRQVSGVLKGAEDKGLCKLVVLSNATLGELSEEFTRYRDRVAVFHYGGHADSGRLLLESGAAGGGGAAAGAGGLSTFLGLQGGLQLVFLNGCSTGAQADRLLGAGVPAVIATARAIEDTVARDFAAAFYTQLAAGRPLRAAYEASRGLVIAGHGDAPRSYYQHRDFAATEAATAGGVDPVDVDGFPWTFSAGPGLVGNWNLPDAARDPLFGLPPVPERDLPESPFRHLSWFSTEHAEVFFGRGYQIREIYQKVTERSADPILLLCGPSGVGKSSLLEAGLLPRLDRETYEVRYGRRDPKEGLMASLRGALGSAREGVTAGEAWRAEEARVGKDLVVVLDQVEEAFTRTGSERPRDLDDLIEALTSVFGIRDARPRGRLVLGFRKEWLAEIDQRFAEARLPRTTMFLEPLDSKGVAEAVSGPAREGRLRDRYRLAVEDGLPELIAGDLMADAGSAVAPTLQVLLTRMWEGARLKNPDQPVFNRALYGELKAKGYLLKSVLDEGLAAIGRWNDEVVASGLCLDVLAYHATDLGTAAQVTRDDLERRYGHRLDVLDGLTGRAKDSYLLIEAGPPPSTRLAHDLLAPLVLQRFRLSTTPGQRARRLLENRVTDWADGKTGSVIERADLAIVEAGRAGMRALTDDEARLLDASRQANERAAAREAADRARVDLLNEEKLRAEDLAKQETEQRLKDQEEANREQARANRKLRLFINALFGTLVVALCLTVFAFWERGQARESLGKKVTAEKERVLAQVNELLRTDPRAVPEILKSVRTQDAAKERVRALRSDPTLTEGEKVRASLALLPDDPSEAEFLYRKMLASETDPRELLLIRGALVSYSSRYVADLWKTVGDPKVVRETRLRSAALLAAFGPPDDPLWKATAGTVVSDLLGSNPLHLGTWIEALRPVRGALLGPLVQSFRAKDPSRDSNERQVAATVLDDYAADRPVLVLDLLKDADARQYPLLFAWIGGARAAAVAAMKDEIARAPKADDGNAARDALASRQANALITLARFGETDPLWTALSRGPDPRLRSYLIRRIGPLGVAPRLLVDRLGVEKDPSVRAAIVMAFADYTTPALPFEISNTLVERLSADYARDPDPEYHSAIAWLLSRWIPNRITDLDTSFAREAPDPGRSWYVNPDGQTFVVVRDPPVFTMGSPAEEKALGRNKVERPHSCKIPRSFAISTREVTVADFRVYLDEMRATLGTQFRGLIDFLDEDQVEFSPYDDGPIVSVTWFQAARFCRWLSEREHVAEDQMCFPPVREIKQDMTLPQNYLSRTGYRLPTEAEWEYACRAGAQTPWSFGSDESLTKDFAWYLFNSSVKNHPKAHVTRQLKPNGLGLFDMHGNVFEWCMDRNSAYPETREVAVEDREQPGLVVHDGGDADRRIYRGGSFDDLTPMLRSAYRDLARPANHFPVVGFRLARTWHPR